MTTVKRPLRSIERHIARTYRDPTGAGLPVTRLEHVMVVVFYGLIAALVLSFVMFVLTGVAAGGR